MRASRRSALARRNALQRRSRRAGGGDLPPVPVAGGTHRFRLRSVESGRARDGRTARDGLSVERRRAAPSRFGRVLGGPQRGRCCDLAQTARVAADSPYGVEAEDLLHPTLKLPGLPYLLLDVQPPRAIQKLPAAAELAALASGPPRGRRRGRSSSMGSRYGPTSSGRSPPSVSSRQPRSWRRTTRQREPPRRSVLLRRPNPAKAFGRLGPLTGVFPKSAVVGSTSVCCCSGTATRRRRCRSSGSRLPTSRALPTRKTRRHCLRICLALGLSKGNMSRTAYGGCGSAHGILRHREGGGHGRDSRSF